MGEPHGCLFFPRWRFGKVPFKRNLLWCTRNFVGLVGKVLPVGRKNQWPCYKDYSTLSKVTKMI